MPGLRAGAAAAAVYSVLSLCWPDCHEHPELGAVQYGHQRIWNDKETDR